jgi:hypothetical protein
VPNVVHAPQLRDRVLVLVDAQVDEGVGLTVDDPDGGRLAAATIAACRLAGHQGGEQSVGEVGVRRSQERGLHRLEHRRSGEEVAGYGDALPDAMPGEGVGLAAGEGRRAAGRVDDGELAPLDVGVPGDERRPNLLRRRAGAEQVESVHAR